MKIGNVQMPMYKWGILFYEDFGNDIGFSAIENISKDMEKSVEKNKEEFNQKVESIIEAIGEENKHSFYQHNFELDERILDEVEVRQRYLNIISIFSFFEERLSSICGQIESEFNFKVKISDLNSNDMIMKYINYLEKVYEIDTAKIEPDFTPIKQQKIIRNILTHQGGYLRAKEERKIELAPHLKVERGKVVIEGNDYLLFLIDKMKSFFSKLYLEIDSRYKELKGIK
nr:hypothetical protein [uncultured Allomuricauda sp.]